MTARSFTDLLRETADALAVMPRHEVAALLRRAALRIENVAPIALDPLWDAALASVAEELCQTREDAIRTIVREWLISNAYVPAELIEEDGETVGNA